MKLAIAICAAIALSGCVTREVKEDSQTISTEKSVTKEDRTHAIDVVADVPGVGPVQIKGQLMETTFSETLTEGEANTARRLVESNPAIQQGMQMIVSAGSRAISGDWIGAGKELGMYLLMAFGVGGFGYGAKKNGEGRGKDQQIEHLKRDADEGWAKAIEAERRAPPPT